MDANNDLYRSLWGIDLDDEDEPDVFNNLTSRLPEAKAWTLKIIDSLDDGTCEDCAKAQWSARLDLAIYEGSGIYRAEVDGYEIRIEPLGHE